MATVDPESFTLYFVCGRTALTMSTSSHATGSLGSGDSLPHFFPEHYVLSAWYDPSACQDRLHLPQYPVSPECSSPYIQQTSNVSLPYDFRNGMMELGSPDASHTSATSMSSSYSSSTCPSRSSSFQSISSSTTIVEEEGTTTAGPDSRKTKATCCSQERIEVYIVLQFLY
jgi:hypothetical protein